MWLSPGSDPTRYVCCRTRAIDLIAATKTGQGKSGTAPDSDIVKLITNWKLKLNYGRAMGFHHTLRPWAAHPGCNGKLAPALRDFQRSRPNWIRCWIQCCATIAQADVYESWSSSSSNLPSNDSRTMLGLWTLRKLFSLNHRHSVCPFHEAESGVSRRKMCPAKLCQRIFFPSYPPRFKNHVRFSVRVLRFEVLRSSATAFTANVAGNDFFWSWASISVGVCRWVGSLPTSVDWKVV